MHSDIRGDSENFGAPAGGSDRPISSDAYTFLSMSLSLTIEVYMGGIDKPSLKLRTADIFADLGWPWDRSRAERIVEELESIGAIEVAVRTSAVCSFYVCAKGAELVSQDWDSNHP